MKNFFFDLFFLAIFFSLVSALPIDHKSRNLETPPPGFPPLTEPTSLPKFPPGHRGVWYTVEDKDGERGEESTVWMKTHNWSPSWFGQEPAATGAKDRQAYKDKFIAKLKEVFEADFQGPVIFSPKNVNIWGPTQSGKDKLAREVGIRFDVHGTSDKIWLRIPKIFTLEKEPPQYEYYHFTDSEHAPLLVFK